MPLIASLRSKLENSAVAVLTLIASLRSKLENSAVAFTTLIASLRSKLENSAVAYADLSEFALQTRKFGGGIYAAEFLETYRSGHNGAHSKCVWRATATWVRIPPSPLNTSIKKQRKVQNEAIPQKHFTLFFYIIPKT